MNLKHLKKVLYNPLIPLSYLWVAMSPLIKSSERFLRVYYRMRTGMRLNLDNPVSFQDKTQWLKLQYTDPLYTKLVDKYAVRQFVADRIGEEHLIPLLGVYDKFEDINFDLLPNQFVLKATHDSGSVVICKDKSNFDVEAARKKLNKSLKRNYFWKGREYPYKNVPPRIVAEQFMVDEGNNGQIPDYKFFVLNGKPEMLFVAEGRFSKEGASFTFLDMDWNVMPIFAKGHEGTGAHIAPFKPACYEEMKDIVEKLCLDIPYHRVDLYTINNKVYFGEYTFFHDGGVVLFSPDEWNYKLGEMIKLPADM